MDSKILTPNEIKGKIKVFIGDEEVINPIVKVQAATEPGKPVQGFVEYIILMRDNDGNVIMVDDKPLWLPESAELYDDYLANKRWQKEMGLIADNPPVAPAIRKREGIIKWEYVTDESK